VTWIDDVAAQIMAGFAADPGTTGTDVAALASVAYRWADAMEVERARRALAEPAEEPTEAEEDREHHYGLGQISGYRAGIEDAAKVVADAHREINDREGTDRVTTMIIKAWLANAEIEIRALAQPAATGENYHGVYDRVDPTEPDPGQAPPLAPKCGYCKGTGLCPTCAPHQAGATCHDCGGSGALITTEDAERARFALGWTGNQPCPTCGIIQCNAKNCGCSWPSTRTDGCPLHGPPTDEQGERNPHGHGMRG